ncbi:hypothetical protein ACSSV4_001873 [Roseovarius sp. MBR-154]|jgi:hypothetical protein
MFHTNLITRADLCVTSPEELELRKFLSEHREGLAHAAALLADRRGARLVAAISEALEQPGRMTRRLHRLLLELRGILFLDHAYDDPEADFGCLQMLEPEDPVVPEICLLADGLNDALRVAGITPVSDERAA